MLTNSVLLRCKSCRAINRVPVDKLKDYPLCGKCKAGLRFPSTPVNGSSANFNEEVLEWPGIVLVEFYARWCGACRLIAPILDQLAAERAGRLKIIKIDIDQEPLMTSHFHIKATPTLVIFKHGSKVNEMAGALDKKEMEEWIDGSLKGDNNT